MTLPALNMRLWAIPNIIQTSWPGVGYVLLLLAFLSFVRSNWKLGVILFSECTQWHSRLFMDHLDDLVEHLDIHVNFHLLGAGHA